MRSSTNLLPDALPFPPGENRFQRFARSLSDTLPRMQALPPLCSEKVLSPFSAFILIAACPAGLRPIRVSSFIIWQGAFIASLETEYAKKFVLSILFRRILHIFFECYVYYGTFSGTQMQSPH